MEQPKKVAWKYTEERQQFGKTVLYRARATRQEIVVQGEIKDSSPRLWIEVGMPKPFGLIAATDQTALEAKLQDFKP
jgi:hypothetical protein